MDFLVAHENDFFAFSILLYTSGKFGHIYPTYILILNIRIQSMPNYNYYSSLPKQKPYWMLFTANVLTIKLINEICILRDDHHLYIKFLHFT